MMKSQAMDRKENIWIEMVTVSFLTVMLRVQKTTVIPITSFAVKTDEYTRKMNDINNPITRYVLSNVSFTCFGSVMLSHKDIVMKRMLKRIAANIKIIFRAIPNFFSSSLIKCVISVFLLCKFEKEIFQCILLVSHTLQTNTILNDGF